MQIWCAINQFLFSTYTFKIASVVHCLIRFVLGYEDMGSYIDKVCLKIHAVPVTGVFAF